jgi:hypothetical protein
LPNSNYTIYAPIAIVTQPAAILGVCDTYNITATVVSSPVDFYQWQVFTGSIWNNLTNNGTYLGVNADVLQINNVTPAMDGLRYRVILENRKQLQSYF